MRRLTGDIGQYGVPTLAEHDRTKRPVGAAALWAVPARMPQRADHADKKHAGVGLHRQCYRCFAGAKRLFGVGGLVFYRPGMTAFARACPEARRAERLGRDHRGRFRRPVGRRASRRTTAKRPSQIAHWHDRPRSAFSARFIDRRGLVRRRLLTANSGTRLCP
jgi:hypothetical protein